MIQFIYYYGLQKGDYKCEPFKVFYSQRKLMYKTIKLKFIIYYSMPYGKNYIQEKLFFFIKDPVPHGERARERQAAEETRIYPSQSLWLLTGKKTFPEENMRTR